MKKFDLIVCGAGMAGFAAAVGAARAGSKVLLLDKMPSVGGMAVYAITGFLSGWPFPRRAGGVADELVKLLEERKALIWRNNAAYEEDALQMEIWLNENDIPVCAEILYDGRRIVTMNVENFSIR